MRTNRSSRRSQDDIFHISISYIDIRNTFRLRCCVTVKNEICAPYQNRSKLLRNIKKLSSSLQNVPACPNIQNHQAQLRTSSKMANRGYDVVVDVDTEVGLPEPHPNLRRIQLQ